MAIAVTCTSRGVPIRSSRVLLAHPPRHTGFANVIAPAASTTSRRRDLADSPASRRPRALEGPVAAAADTARRGRQAAARPREARKQGFQRSRAVRLGQGKPQVRGGFWLSCAGRRRPADSSPPTGRLTVSIRSDLAFRASVAPSGRGQADDRRPRVVTVQAINYENEATEECLWPSVTVYFHYGDLAETRAYGRIRLIGGAQSLWHHYS